MEWEKNICKWCDWQGVNIQNKQIACTAQYQKANNQKKGRRPKQINFTKEDTQMANRHMKKCLAMLIIREMEIKTTTGYHLTSARLAILKKSINIKYQKGCGKKKEPSYNVGKNVNWYSHYREQYEGA